MDRSSRSRACSGVKQKRASTVTHIKLAMNGTYKGAGIGIFSPFVAAKIFPR